MANHLTGWRKAEMGKSMTQEMTVSDGTDRDPRTGKLAACLGNPCELDRLDTLAVTLGAARLPPVRATGMSIMVERFMAMVDDIIVSAGSGFDGVALAIRDRVQLFRQEFRFNSPIQTFA